MSSSISSLLGASQVTAVVTQTEQRLQAPITIEQNLVKTDQAQISALGTVQGALSSLSGALSTIADPASINDKSATVSGTNVTATASSGAAAGSYNLTNVKLAKAQELYSSIYASSGAAIGSGNLTFKFSGGGSATIAVSASQNTVSGIASAINAANKGVSASVVQSSSGARLVLTGGATGSAQAFKVSGTGGLASLNYGSGATSTVTQAQAASNATFKINGVPVSQATNAASKVVPGVALNLIASGSAAVTVAVSPGNISAALSQFTTKLNSAITTVQKQTAYKPGASSASASGSAKQATTGPLLGNIQVEQLGNSLLSSVSSAAASGLSANAIGLTVGSGGSVTFDASTFATAYQKNPTGVNTLIKQIESSTSSVVTDAIGSTAPATPSSGSGNAATAPAPTVLTGFLQSSTSDIKATITSTNQQITAQQALDLQTIQNLETQFTAAEAATGGTSTTLAYLSSLLGTKSSG